ncbi:hypothetical protein I3760_16G008600 [Carya illinoinensis]|nr:uncharacterized protein LOC122299851 [Carya illinoinensis]KAG2663048.1 hypothetical protein I3760_16G008600 [Carya illinoinensis]
MWAMAVQHCREGYSFHSVSAASIQVKSSLFTFRFGVARNLETLRKVWDVRASGFRGERKSGFGLFGCQSKPSIEMCHYQPWEDAPHQGEDFPQRTGNGIEHMEARWETRMAMLEARIARVEARVEKLEATMLQMRRGMRVVCVMFLVAVVYSICK